MKLAAGNPNLMRTNPNVGLAAVPNKLGDKNPDAVPPPQMNLWARDQYVPEKNAPARRGADDFLRVQSRGF